MPASGPPASDRLRIRAESTASNADDQHVVELLAALAAQTVDRWQLELVTPKPRQAKRWQAILATQSGDVRDRVRVTRPARPRDATFGTAVLRLRVDDVPLAHLVETVLSFPAGVQLRVAVQDVRQVRWPSGVAGWTPVGPPTPDPGAAVSLGDSDVWTPDVVLLRRRLA